MKTLLTILLALSLSGGAGYAGFHAGRFHRGLEAERTQQVLRDSAIAAGCLKPRLTDGKNGQTIRYRYEAPEELAIEVNDLMPPIPVKGVR